MQSQGITLTYLNVFGLIIKVTNANSKKEGREYLKAQERKKHLLRCRYWGPRAGTSWRLSFQPETQWTSECGAHARDKITARHRLGDPRHQTASWSLPSHHLQSPGED